MPRTNVSVAQITRAGIAPPDETNGDSANNHVVSNNGRVVLLIRNSGTTVARTVTFRFPVLIDGQSVIPKAVSIPTSASRYFGPFPVDTYGARLQVDVDNAELKLTAFGI
ncbi:hypothetical protein ACWEQC_06760 [Streptomyces shenzhenensis]